MEIKKRKKVLLIGNSHLVIFKFRKELVEKLSLEGYDVWVSFPNGPFGEGQKSSKEFGCNFIECKMNRRGKNPLQEIRLIFQYYSIIKDVNPDVVLAYTVKSDIYGGIASRILKKDFIPNITGLGKGLSEGKITKIIISNLYKIALKKAKCVFFQNSSDKQFFEQNKIMNGICKLLPGSGVNLEEFTPLPYPKDKVIRFTYVARVMKAKGIEEYLEAAKQIKDKYSNVEFHICGFCEEDYKNILLEYEKKNIIIYHGLVDNVIEYVRESSCIVLPSFHPEGISNVLLEAAACARPIITTNRPGCKETVDNGISGYLIEERNSHELILAIEKFIKLNNNQREKMGIKGRKKIELQFNRQIVVNEYLKVIE